MYYWALTVKKVTVFLFHKKRAFSLECVIENNSLNHALYWNSVVSVWWFQSTSTQNSMTSRLKG